VSIKVVIDGKAKKKYQAQVWFKGKFICSGMFDSKAQAREYHKESLLNVVKNTLVSASERRENRLISEGLHRSMQEWAKLYVEHPEHPLKKNRKEEYRKVGRLTAEYTLEDLQGNSGLKLLVELKHLFFASRELASQPEPGAQVEPLKPNTVRLQLTALCKIIKFAASQLPDEVPYKPIPFGELKLPPAHAAPRVRLPKDSEYSRLIRHLGRDSDMGEFLESVDETGCRLSEITGATKANIEFFWVGEQLVGGCLTLNKHKTLHQVAKPRYVPLSLFAAEIFWRRCQQHDTGSLFPSLKTSDAVCKQFDSACSALSINDLLIKDFRRAFINRNKNQPDLSTWDLISVVGESSILKKTTAAEKRVQDAVGHEDAGTTAGYSVADMRQISEVFTRTSRLLRVLAAASPGGGPAGSNAASIQEKIGALLAEARALTTVVN
jgi:integrase